MYTNPTAHQQRDFMISLHLTSRWPEWAWPTLETYELRSPWSAERLSHTPTEGNQMTLAFWNYLLLLLAQFSFICTASQCPDISHHSCSHSFISYLFEKVSMTTSESKMRTFNYTYPNMVKILINLSPIIWKLEYLDCCGCYHIQFSEEESFHLMESFETILLSKTPPGGRKTMSTIHCHPFPLTSES